jgi:hypothetical protein
MLVVIAILGVLAALAIPVGGRMRNAGLTTASMGNLRGIHGLFMVYVNENDWVFPSARGRDAQAPNSGTVWTRAIWEHSNGKFSTDPAIAIKEMSTSDYAKKMWCPLMVKRYGEDQHPSGRSSYALNGFFVDVLDGYGRWQGANTEANRRLARDNVLGRREPLIVAGTLHPGDKRFGTYPIWFSSKYPYDTDWMNLHYAYGGGSDCGLGLFLDGHVELIPRKQGVELHTLINDFSNFE